MPCLAKGPDDDGAAQACVHFDRAVIRTRVRARFQRPRLERSLRRKRFTAAHPANRHALARATPADAAHRTRGILDGFAIDRDDDIAGTQPEGGGRRAVRVRCERSFQRCGT